MPPLPLPYGSASSPEEGHSTTLAIIKELALWDILLRPQRPKEGMVKVKDSSGQIGARLTA